MKTKPNLRTLAASLMFASSLALAGETTTDSTEFQVRTASGEVEKVKVENLEIGEVRNVTSERGTSVVVGRHEKGYVLDIAGERIEVNAPDVHSLSTQEEVVIQDGDGAGAGKRVLISLGDHDKREADAAGHRHVVVVSRDGTDGEVIRISEGDGAEKRVHEMGLDDPELGNKRVLVVRKIEKTITEGEH